jgi:hypothetical protein
VTTDRPIGNYTIDMDVSKSFYQTNTTSKVNAFNLGYQPSLSSPSVSPTFEGWGYQYMFQVLFTDLDYQTNNITLWKSYDNITWYYVDSVLDSGVSRVVKFFERFECTDFQSGPLIYFKFNTTDEFGFTDETEALNFSVEEDDVTVEINTTTSNTSVRRNGSDSAFLDIRIYDSDYQVYQNLTKATIYISLNGSEYGYNQSCNSSYGLCNTTYYPDCASDVGVQSWKGGTTDICYKSVNSSPSTLDIIGQFNITIVNPQENDIFNRNWTHNLNATVEGECSEVVTNAMINWSDNSTQIASGYNTSWSVPNLYDKGAGIVIGNVTRQYYDYDTKNVSITVHGLSGLISMTPPNGTAYQVGQTVTVRCIVYDLNEDQPLPNYTVSFYKNNTFQQTNVTGSDGITTWFFGTTGEPYGYVNVSCNISDNNTLYYTATVQHINTILKLEKRLIIKTITVDNSTVYRNDSYTPYNTNITVKVEEGLLGASDNSTVWFYNSTDLLGTCQTNSSGICGINYNPDDSSPVGGYTIYMNATKTGVQGSITNTTNINVQGKMFVNITSPPNGSAHSKSNITTLAANITNESGGLIDVGTLTSFFWYNDTSDNIGSGTPIPFNLITQSTGIRYITAVAVEDYFDNANDTIQIQVNGLADVVWAYPADSSSVTYPYPFLIACSVQDSNSGNGIEGYSINFSYLNGSDYIYIDSKVTNSSGSANVTWNVTGKGSIGFKCNITDNNSLFYSANVDEVFANITVADQVAPVISNISIYPTSGMEAYKNTTNITANVTDDYLVVEVNASITLPNGSTQNITMNLIPAVNNFSTIHNASDSGFNHTEYVNASGAVTLFNVTISNQNGTTIYFNLSINGVMIASNQSVSDGANATVNVLQVLNLTIPGNQTIEVNITDISGSSASGNYTAYLNYTTDLQTFYRIVYLPLYDGGYSVNIVAKDDVPEENVNITYAGSFTVAGKIIGPIYNNPDLITVTDITYFDNSTFNLTVNFTNNGSANAYDVNISVTEDPNIYYNVELLKCGNLTPGQTCTKSFNVTVLAGTIGGIDIYIYGVATWINPDKTINSTNASTKIIVTANPIIDIYETSLPATMHHNTTIQIGTITVRNIGNYRVNNINVTTSGGNFDTSCTYPPGCTIDIFPSWQGYMLSGQNFTSTVTVFIPAGQDPNDYYTSLVAITSDGGSDSIIMNVTVLRNASWSRDETDFGTILTPPNTTGFIGEINVNSTANVPIVMSVGHQLNASQFVVESPLSFTLNKLGYQKVLVNYSIPPLASPGMYDLIIRIDNSSATPQYMDTVLTLNVTDIPPSVTNVTIDPLSFEAGYDNTTIRANVTDNLGVDSVWASVVTPNSTIMNVSMLFTNGTEYMTNYSSPQGGIHEVIVCANDSAGLQACSDFIPVTASVNTTVVVRTNQTPLAQNVTFYSGENVTLNFNISIAGYSRAFIVNSTTNPLQNWSTNPSYFEVSLLLKNESVPNSTLVWVPATTAPGIYYLNFSSVWMNADNTSGSNVSKVAIEVGSNPVLNVSNVSMLVGAGSSNIANLTLLGVGNDNVTNISIACVSGNACFNFTNLTFSPSAVSTVSPGEERNVTVNVSTDLGFPFGTYLGVINVTTNSTVIQSNISIIVAQNLSWSHSPVILSNAVIQNKNGTFGAVNVTNTGNDIVTVVVDFSGNSSLFSADVSSITLGVLESELITINYSSPQAFQKQEYTAYLRTTNNTASPSQQTSFLNMTVEPLLLNIISPTATNPVINIDPGENISTVVNVSYAGSPISENVTLSVSLFGTGANTTPVNITANFSNVTNLWNLNFTAPNLSTGRAYSLNVTMNYTSQNLNDTDIETNAIVYNDSAAPSIVISLPLFSTVNTTILISVNVTDFGGVENVTMNITLPDGNWSYYNLTYISTTGDTETHEMNFTNTSQLGIYSVYVLAFDKSGNYNTESTTFQVFPTIEFAGYSYDEENISKPAIVVNFSFFNNETGGHLLNILSDANSGYYNQAIEARAYHIEVDAFGHKMRFNDSVLKTNVYNPVLLGKIPASRIATGALTGLTIDAKLNFSNMTASLDYSPYSGIDANLLSIFRCTSYIKTVGCNGTWSRASVTTNTTLQTVTVLLNNKTEYLALAPYICGDDTCDKAYGESKGNCPQDCETDVPPVPPTPGGPGGAGAGAGAGANLSLNLSFNISVPDIVPFEFDTNLIDIEIEPGQQVIYSSTLRNNLNRTVTADLSVDGVVFSLVTLQKSTVTMGPKDTEIIKIVVTALPSTAPGIYTGDIVIGYAGKDYRMPITVKVIIPPFRLLDVFIYALTKFVPPGKDLETSVKFENKGRTATIDDIVATYSVRPINSEDIIYTESETIAIEQALTFQKAIPIPNETLEGTYIIQLDVSYANTNLNASAADSFTVTAEAPILYLLRSLFLNPFTYLILFAILPGLYGGRRFYKSYKLKKVKKARYIFPMDDSKLPQPGPQSILVGKIAETTKDAYINKRNLMMHSIAAGGTGSGKSVSAMVCAEELLKLKVPVIVFDPTAQWTGFIKAQTDKAMLDLFAKFGMKPSDARSFKTNIYVVDDPKMSVDVTKHMKPGEITVFVMSGLRTADIDKFVRKTIDNIFAVQWPESADLKLMIIYDEVHRLLPKYGGKGGYVQLERGCREFRKWGIGLFLISQVLSDFKGAIRANIANEIQLRTKYVGDINRVKSKFGPDYAGRVVRLVTGTGLVQNPEYNDGKPWFISFRPLMHNTRRLTDAEIKAYVEVNEKIIGIDKRLEALKARGVDTYDVELELNMAKDKMKSGLFKMAQTYLESVEARIKKLGG